MYYLLQYKRIKQVVNISLVLTLALSNLATQYENPSPAQSSLRQQATFQTEEPRVDLETSLAESDRLTPATIRQLKEFMIKLRTTQINIFKDRKQPPFEGAFKKKTDRAKNLYLVGWREGEKVHQVVTLLPFIPPQTEVTLSCHFLEEPPQGIEKQWVLMIDTPKDTVFRLFAGKGIYLTPIKLPLASRKGGLALAKIAPEQDITIFTRMGNFTDPRNPPCSQDRFSITPIPDKHDVYTYGLVYLGSWVEIDRQGRHEYHQLRASISSNHLEKDKDGNFLPLYIEPVYIKGIPKESGGSQWILIAKTLAGDKYYRFKKEAKHHLIKVNNRNIPLGFRIADETIVKRITPQVALKSSSAGAVMELPRVDAGPYMERIDWVRSYLDRLSKGLEREEDLLDEISKTQGAEGLIADTTAGVRKARVRLKQAEINIKRLSRAMKEQNLPSLINALRKIPNGAEEKLSRLQTLAFLFVKEIAKLSKETARPHPVIDFNPWAVLFISQKSWLSDMFAFHGAGKIVEISDGENSTEILLIKAEEKSLVEIIKSILHESIHRRFTRGRRIIEETQPELLPFYHILEEAAAESLTMEVFEYLKRTELGHYLLEEIPKKGIYDYISTEEYYLYEREFSKVLKKNLGERIGEYLEEFLTKGDPQLLRDALGEQAEEFIEKLLRGDNTKPLKKVLENQARRCIDEFLINANPEPLKKILGPLWERITSITERINIFNNVDVSKQDLVYDTAVRMIFLFLPHPDAAAKMDAGILLLDALEEMDLEDIAEIEFKLFLEFGPESFNQCIDRAVLRVIKEILKAEGIDLKTAKSDFQHKLYQYTIEEAQRCLPAIELPHSQENIKASSSGTHSLPVKVSPAEETMEELSKGVSILDITDTNQMKDIMKSLLPGALFKKYGPGKIELRPPELPILSKGAEALPAYAWAIHFESKKGRVLLALSDNRNKKGNALVIERLVLTENNKPGMAPKVIMGIFSSLENFGRQAGYHQLRCEVSLTNNNMGGYKLVRLYEMAGFHPDEQSSYMVELIEEAAKAKTDIKDLAGLDRFVTELAIQKGLKDLVGLEKDLKTKQMPPPTPAGALSVGQYVGKSNGLEKAIAQSA